MHTERRNFLKGMAFLSPWLIGFLGFLLLPVILSFYYSLCDYQLLQKPVFIGMKNYVDLWNDKVFWKVLKNTFEYAAMALPAGLFVSLGLALLLNVQVPGQAIFRTIVFLPSLTPAAATAMVWLFLLNARQGLLNSMLGSTGAGLVVLLIILFAVSLLLFLLSKSRGQKPSRGTVWMLIITSVLLVVWLFVELLAMKAGGSSIWNAGIEGPKWLDVDWVLKTMAGMSVWGVGNTVVIYLAGLQDVPKELYEAAEIDGASTLRRLWHVTLPTLSPVIFFNLIMAIIGTLQNFTIPQLMTQGNPDNASRFYSMYVYDNGFTQLRMGYASAMAWIQLLIVLALTGIAFWTSKRWVHYQGK